MRNTFITLLIALTILGCESDPPARIEPPPPVPPPPAALDKQHVYNLAKLDPVVPPAARSAFERDFPGVGVTNAEMQASSTGPMLYKIVFVRDGRPYSVVYDGAGKIVTPAVISEQTNPPRPGFPPNPPGGATP